MSPEDWNDAISAVRRHLHKALVQLGLSMDESPSVKLDFFIGEAIEAVNTALEEAR